MPVVPRVRRRPPAARSRAAGITIALLAAALALTGAAPAQASRPDAAGAACSDPTGITVVVDFRELGGGVHVGCASQPVASGFEALAKAGFQVTNVTRFPGALCRIDGKPADDPCQDMPPADAYWAYWISARGGSWCYSSQGPSRKPPAGTVEGWAFAKDRATQGIAQPGVAPPAPIPGTTPSTVGHSSCPSEPTTTTTKAPTSTAATTAPTAPSTAPPTGGSATGGTAAPRSTGGASTTAPLGASIDGADPSTSSTGAESDGTPSSSTSRDDDVASGPLTVRDRDEDPGSPAGLALAASGVLVLGGGAVLTARRRRAPSPGAGDLEA